MIDMHVHILPGVDDGSCSEAMTRAMLKRAREAGITRIVCTPHVYRPEDQAKNRRPLRFTREAAHAAGIPLDLGCEFNYRALLAAQGQDLSGFCLGGTRCILLEFSNEHLIPGWEAMISEMMDAGLLPIIAHPERYAYVQRDPGVARAMSDLGCELQVDAGGLMAQPFGAERRTARWLLREGLVAYIASDAHRPSHYDAFERAYRTFRGEWPCENRLLDSLKAQRKENRDDG